MDGGTGFTYVAKRGRSEKKKTKAKTSFSDALELAGKVLTVKWEEVEAIPDWKADRVICVGLGSPLTSLDSRYQLIYLMELVKKIGLPSTKVELYDPAFSDEDTKELRAMGFTVVAGPAVMALSREESTVAFMPHCEIQLYEEFLRCNWSRESLRRTTLLANDLSAYADNLPREKFHDRYPCIARIVPLTKVISFPDALTVMNAFSNMAVQGFGDVVGMDDVDPFWDPPPNPGTQSTES